MTFKIEIDGWMAPYEYMALSNMFKQLADGLEADRKRRGFYDEQVPDPTAEAVIHEHSSTLQNSTALQSEQTAPTATRERGKPAPGRARRTKEEIAEDEAAEQAETTKQSISTGEERVGPEDEPAVQEQDKADEQAEVEASREPEKPVTIDDVKNAFGLYITKFGMDAVKEDGVNILADTLKNETLPAGETFWKASTIPEGRYGDVIKAFEKAANGDARYKPAGA